MKILYRFPIFFIILSAICLGLLTNCSRGSEFNLEQQQVFEAQFYVGMSRAEVENKLDLFGPYTFVEEWTFPNGDLRVEYRTDIPQNWGSPTYYFRFSPEDELISLYPIHD